MESIALIHTLDTTNQISTELRVAKLINEAQPDWHIIHSRWLVGSAPRRTLEGEGDIIVVVPNLGFLVIEVKGAKGVKVERGVWYRNSPETSNSDNWIRYDKPPWQQAAGVMHYFRERVSKAIGHTKFGSGFAVAFPNAQESSAFSSDADLYGNQIRSEDYIAMTLDAGMLADAARHAEDFLRGQMHHAKCDTNAILDVLLPSGRILRPNQQICADDAKQRFIQLTAKQTEAANGATENRRVLIRGGPGTGKSVVAQHLARQFVKEGRRCMILCFNRLLMEDTAFRLSGSGVIVKTIHQFGTETVQATSNELGGRAQDSFDSQDKWFDYCTTEGLGRAIEGDLVKEFDVLIVDEFQDLNDHQSMVVRSLPAKNVIILCDPNQNLFGDVGAGNDNIDGFAKYSLPDNIRNCREVAMCVQLLAPPNARHEAIASSPVMYRWPSVQTFNDQDSLGHHLKQIRDEWRRWGFTPARIALLAPSKVSVDLCVKAMNAIDWPCTSHLSHWRTGKACFVGTIRSFKGLDADGVVLIDPPAVGSPVFSSADAYVATSRACLDLRVLVRSQPDAGWLQTAVDAAKCQRNPPR